ncbi:hypothetical protein TOC8171_48440 [Pseudomonas syringae]
MRLPETVELQPDTLVTLILIELSLCFVYTFLGLLYSILQILDYLNFLSRYNMDF